MDAECLMSDAEFHPGFKDSAIKNGFRLAGRNDRGKSFHLELVERYLLKILGKGLLHVGRNDRITL